MKSKFDCLAKVEYKPLGEDRGEDALSFDCEREDMHTLAVFDGCGGAGAWKYPEFRNLTGAFVAAQSVAQRHLDWFDGITAEAVRDKEELKESFHSHNEKILQQLKQQCKPMGVAGSLVKSFPCTASCAVVAEYDETSLLLTALNAGDSRVYFMTPSDGLIQLTKDDSRGDPDPLDSLRDNPPLSNLLNADKPYKVCAHQMAVQYPCVVLCATDGVFGFVRSPMDFEFMLLDTLVNTKTAEEFEQKFERKVRKLTGDDSTCLIAFYGFGSYENVRQLFSARHQEIGEIIRAIDALPPQEQEACVRHYWADYKLKTVCSEMAGITNE